MSIQANNDYRIAAEAAYKQLAEMNAHVSRLQGEYGRWLINTLWLFHSGAIAGLLFKAGSSGPLPDPTSLVWFVAGMVLAFGAGFAAWCNFTFVTCQLQRWANHQMLTDPACWPKGGPDWKIPFSMWVAIGFGVLSLFCLVGGTYGIFRSWPVALQ